MGKKQKFQDSDGSGISNNGVDVEISTQKAEKKDRKQKVKGSSEVNEANGTAAFDSALKVLQKDGLYESKKEEKKKKKRKNSVEEDDNHSQGIEKKKKKAKSENGVEGVSQGLQNGSLVRCKESGFVIGCVEGKKGKEENGIEEKDVTVSGEGVELAKYAALKSFSEAGLPDEVLDCCKTFDKPSPIQSTAWPFLLDGRDFIGIAATGSGKTLAFGVPALMHVRHKMKKGQKRVPRILVLSPTRELAQQIADVLSDAGKPCGVKTVCLYGGTPKGPQISCLKSGVEIVVGTPGRLKDLIEMGFCRLNEVSFVVLDEADRMLDMGFEPEVRSILKHTSSSRQMVMFSATWPLPVHQLAQEFMDPNPVKVVIGSEDLAANHDVMQIIEVLEDQSRDGRLVSLLEKYHHSKTNRVLIFVLYKKEATRVEMFLQRRGWKVVSVHGDRSQESRTKALSLFKSGECPLMIATDVAARGLDIPNVEVVINYSFPLTTEDYVHRIGRTGRAGKKGVAHTFFTKENKALAGELINVLREAGQIIPQELMKFGTHVKKKESKIYGAHFKEITADAPKSKRVTFDDSD